MPRKPASASDVLGLVFAERFCPTALFALDDQRPGELVIASLAPTAYRPDRGLVRKFRHYNAEISGALGATSGEILCHLGYVNGFHH